MKTQLPLLLVVINLMDYGYAESGSVAFNVKECLSRAEGGYIPLADGVFLIRDDWSAGWWHSRVSKCLDRIKEPHNVIVSEVRMYRPVGTMSAEHWAWLRGRPTVPAETWLYGRPSVLTEDANEKTCDGTNEDTPDNS